MNEISMWCLEPDSRLQPCVRMCADLELMSWLIVNHCEDLPLVMQGTTATLCPSRISPEFLTGHETYGFVPAKVLRWPPAGIRHGAPHIKSGT